MIHKFYQIHSLKGKSLKIVHPDFVEYRIPNSDVAFSFLNSIFIGEKIDGKSYLSIINHERVHINQKHSYDLIYFEFMKILFWFNPFLYIYQRYTSELHEYIADFATKKNNSNYEDLLNEAFGVKYFSFTNQFFNQSLIKKRIVMLNKKSKKSSVLKYLMMVPAIVFMLLIFSISTTQAQVNTDLTEEDLKEKAYQEIKKKHEVNTDLKFFSDESFALFKKGVSTEEPLSKEEFYRAGAYLRLMMEKAPNEDSYEKQKNVEVLETLRNSITYDKYLENFKNEKSKADLTAKNNVQFELPPVVINKDETVPFLEIDQAPIFEACENNKTKDCFMREIQNHIKVNFNYPEEAMDKNIQGKVYCSFIINETGEIVIVDLRGPDSILEKSVYDLMMELPKLKPAIHGGKPANMSFSIPISFKLE